MYIDPNTGGMLFQVLAAVLAVFSGAILVFSGKIRAYIARFQRARRGDSPGEEQGDSASTDLDGPPI